MRITQKYISDKILEALSYGNGLSRKAVKTMQSKMKANDKRLLKYMRAQKVLAEYLWQNYEDGGTAIALMNRCETEKELYKVMSKIGFVWTDYNNLWRLDKRLKEPRLIDLL